MRSTTLMRMLFPAFFALAGTGAAWAADSPAGETGTVEETTASQDGTDPRLKKFEESIEELLPLKPNEIKRYIKERDAVESAIEPGPARMRTETRQIHATPGAAPQVVRLTQGYSSTLLFQDSTGAPWPVLSTILGAPKAFQAVQPKIEAGEGAEKAGNVHANLVNLVPLTSHAASNIVVTLEDAPYPIIIHLLTESAAKSGRTSDSLVIFRLDKPGPKANLPPVGPSRITATVSPEMLSFVHGVPPEGSIPLRLTPSVPGVRVWEYKREFYLRTQHAAVWPAWRTVAAGDDVRVYAMPKVPSLVVSVNGKHEKLTVVSAKSGDK